MHTIPDTSGEFTIYDGTNVGKRVCGSCQLCCRLLPVVSIKKAGWTKCSHQRYGKGCMVYGSRQMPVECVLWSCRWLTGQDTADMARPDRSHYVIDIMPDMVTCDGGEYMVIQVWCDPGFPEAHRDPALRAYIQRRAEKDRVATLIRLGQNRAMLIAAPSISADAAWHEVAVNTTDGTGSGNRFVDALRLDAGL